MAAVIGRTLQIPMAEVFEPMLRQSRYKGLYGGRGSGKSHEFANLLIERAMMNQGLRWVCVREIQKSLDQSVKLLLEDKIKEHGLDSYFRVQHNQIGCPGDGVIIFQGMQDHTAASIKSLEGYDGCWVEEAQTLSANSLKLLRPTIRKEYCEYCRVLKNKFDDVRCTEASGHKLVYSEIWFSWNPDEDDDPVDELLRKNDMPDAIVIGTTYRDNPWFPDVLRREMEWDRKIDFESYQHVWEGGYQKRSHSRVFKNWCIEEFTTPTDAQFFTGCDWGFSVDPATMVRCYEERVNPATQQPWPRKRLYIDRECYRVGVEVEDLPKFFDGLVCGCSIDDPNQPCRDRNYHGWARSQRIVADSSRPDTISFLRRHGYTGMEPSKKGPNSVKEGVMFLQGYEIIIHPRCYRTSDEFKGFSFVVDPLNDKVTNVLQDKKNHIIDPLRYALEQLRGALVVRRSVWG